MATLVRINRQTQEPEPELAESWKISRDGKTITFNLRPNIKFTDGATLSADDVLFTFQIINDPKISASSSDLFSGKDGQRVRVVKLGLFKVAFTFPTVNSSAIRIFDGVPILPRHKLEAIYRDGKFEQAWNLSTPPDQIVGLGPFKLKSYLAGQRVVLERNENYWKKDSTGVQLPYLDQLIINIDPDRNTQLLKFQRGETDLLSPVNGDEIGALSPLTEQNQVKIDDLGPSLIREVLWFNLNSTKPGVDPVKQGWFQNVNFRRAISHAIDREAISRIAFNGRAAQQWGFLSDGDKIWTNKNVRKYPFDRAQTRRLLEEAGFHYAANQNLLLDSQNRPVAFSLITNAGNAQRQKIAALIQNDLTQIGVKMTLAFLESKTLLTLINEGANYDACLLAIVSGDADPSTHLNVLLSNGSTHWWNAKQSTPATNWENRIDQLMLGQMTVLNRVQRKKMFDEVQEIMAEQQPFIFLATRNLVVAARSDIGNFKPATLPDFVLWNCEELYRKQ
jgi:peptide/nickel transport system substrate-binding protein